MEKRPLLLATLPADAKQKHLALVIGLLLFGTFIGTLPYRNIQLGPVSSFIPIVDTILFVSDSITAALLFAQFSVLRSRSLLVLGGGYLFTALTIVPHALTFPGIFSPTGLLDAGLQSTAWLYVFWHMGLPSAVIAYVLLKQRDSVAPMPPNTLRLALAATVAAVVVITCALTWLATRGENFLPTIMTDQLHAQFPWHFVPPVGLSIVAIGLLFTRGRSILDLWLLVALGAWLIDALLLNSGVERFSVIWYAGRIYGLLAASFVLLVLLSETTVLYARLALASAAQQRERESRLMTMDAVAASIAHEVKQPLSAIVTNAGIGRRWLERQPPNLERISDVLERIVDDGHRASDVIGSIRAMFGKAHGGRSLLDFNILVRETLTLLHDELELHRVSLQLDLTNEQRQVVADRVQVQQALLHLFTNAVEAMNPVIDRARSLSVKSEWKDSDILLTVEDSGTGIDPVHADRIFDAFFTTKSNGTGMGLSLCKSIVEAHGGRLWAVARVPYGSTFFLRLPGNAVSD